MSDRWWYRTLGQEFGPVSLESIEDMLQRGLLNGRDEIRRGTEENWVRVSESLQLRLSMESPAAASGEPDSGKSQPPPASDERPSPDVRRSEHSSAIRDAARESLQQLHSRYRPATWKARPVVSAQALAAPVAAMFRFVTDIVEAVVALSAPLLRVINAKVVMAALVLLIAAAALWTVPRIWYSRAGTYANLESTWKELRMLRERGAEDSEWSDFERRALQNRTSSLQKLEQHATADDRITMELLWATRDYLPDMLAGAQASPNQAEEWFQYHLRRAEQLIQESKARPSNTDWLFTSVLIVDGMILVLAGSYFLRRFTHRAA